MGLQKNFLPGGGGETLNLHIITSPPSRRRWDFGKSEKYVKNMKEYLLLYRLWDLKEFQDLPLYIDSGT